MAEITRREILCISGVTMMGSLLGATGKTLAEESKSANNKLKIIVVGAHPDDPETGCGGAMALFASTGHEVISAYLTRGEAGISGKSHEEAAQIRTEEANKACRILGVRPAFLGQIDGNCEITKERYKDVYNFLEKENPDMVFSHWPIDTHRDHQVSSLLVYDAWLRLGRKFALYYYEVMSGHQSQNFSPNQYLDISSVVEQKQTACFVHKSQNIEKWYKSVHGRMEEFRGMEFGCKYAEAFIRHVQSPAEPSIG